MDSILLFPIPLWFLFFFLFFIGFYSDFLHLCGFCSFLYFSVDSVLFFFLFLRGFYYFFLFFKGFYSVFPTLPLSRLFSNFFVVSMVFSLPLSRFYFRFPILLFCFPTFPWLSTLSSLHVWLLFFSYFSAVLILSFFPILYGVHSLFPI